MLIIIQIRENQRYTIYENNNKPEINLARLDQLKKANNNEKRMTTEQHNSDQSKTKLWICIMMKAPFENGIGSIKNKDEERYLKLNLPY